MEQIIFYILAVVILIFSLLTVTTRKILRAAIYLLSVLLGTSGIYFMLHYDFLAAVQLTVYAGGIVVLIIFSILLTSQINDRLEQPKMKKKIFSGIAVVAGVVLCISVLLRHKFPKVSAITEETNVKMIGTKLLSYGENGYILPFEVISVLLLAAMVAAIIIAKREKQKLND